MIYIKVESKSSAKIYLTIIPVSDYRDSKSEFEIDENGRIKSKKYSMKRTGTWLNFLMELILIRKKKSIKMSYKRSKKRI